LNTRFFVCDLASLQLYRTGILNVWAMLMVGALPRARVTLRFHQFVARLESSAGTPRRLAFSLVEQIRALRDTRQQLAYLRLPEPWISLLLIGAHMSFSNRLAASRVLFVVLPFLICIIIGAVAGFHGGLHNEATTAYYSSDWSPTIARYNEIRLYGAFVLLMTLSVSALVTFGLFIAGIFPARRKRSR
jgi:hypothetical protein